MPIIVRQELMSHYIRALTSASVASSLQEGVYSENSYIPEQ